MSAGAPEQAVNEQKKLAPGPRENLGISGNGCLTVESFDRHPVDLARNLRLRINHAVGRRASTVLRKAMVPIVILHKVAYSTLSISQRAGGIVGLGLLRHSPSSPVSVHLVWPFRLGKCLRSTPLFSSFAHAPHCWLFSSCLTLSFLLALQGPVPQPPRVRLCPCPSGIFFILTDTRVGTRIIAYLRTSKLARVGARGAPDSELTAKSGLRQTRRAAGALFGGVDCARRDLSRWKDAVAKQIVVPAGQETCRSPMLTTLRRWG
jgi:hypothetical protein